MEITKYERIIFLERDISATKKSIEEWTQYAEGNINLSIKYQYILDEAEGVISEIAKLMYDDELSSRCELERLFENFYDDHYYDYNSAKECADDYRNRYAEISRAEAKELYDCKIKNHSKESAMVRLDILNSELEKRQKKHQELLSSLGPISHIILAWTRKSPTARINRSPSFIMAYVGDYITEGFREGLKKEIIISRKKLGL